MTPPDNVLQYWLDEVGPKGWYAGGEALDAEVTARFRDTWDSAMEGRFGLWLTYPSGALAYIILMDQLPRNMFRHHADAFSSDRYALAAAKQAIQKGWDFKIDAPARQFFYMPLMHSENLSDQDRCVRLMKERIGSDENSNLLHARAHRELIRRFGRFPARNAALGRASTEAEKTFLVGRGYGSVLDELRETA